MLYENELNASVGAPAQTVRPAENSKAFKVLLIEDEPALRRLLRFCLQRDGYEVMEAASGAEGMDAASRCQPDAVLLDLSLPDIAGMSVLQRLREWIQVPIIVVSECAHEDEKIAALDSGANDFVTKPFSTNELLARLRVTQRYAPKIPQVEVFQSGDLFVDLTTRTVKVKGKRARLTATEYSLLRLFVKNAGKVLTHRQIFREVWGSEGADNLSYIRVYLTNLRKKLAPRLIITEPKVWYRLALSE